MLTNKGQSIQKHGVKQKGKHYEKNILIDKRMRHHYTAFFVRKKYLDVKVKNNFNFARNFHKYITKESKT